ncbi:lytic murein transglycosylase [Kordiimonas lacus]|uniref:Membrane-bound lytic murein transglycosylase B n=1 Tax=Kordiimonas lacus TaxID=637679 RepID=A0A1G6WM76_9PROT|nr:lytic murein transglycosylase [Kordiimonas lacus]SDD66992.1 membrane-bound lytic murein transglycosylase B [Kordiimonas lacus]
MQTRRVLKSVLGVFLSLSVSHACLASDEAAPTAVTEPEPAQDAAFKSWLDGVRTEALERGIKSETLDQVLPTIVPVERVIKRDRNQPEVKQTYAMYLKSRVSDWRKEKGALMMKEHADALRSAGERYGVQPRFIAAIWGIETNYGTVPLSYSVFDAVATLAYDKRRAARFRRELFAALEILDKGYADFDLMKGSWAGAMGQPQFMPENYLKYAVDHDGDGHRDIWTSKSDVFASIAHYLKSYGWQDDQTWGRKVKLPKGGEASLQGTQADGIQPDRWCAAYKSMGVWRDLQEWQELGVRRLNGKDLPPRSIPAALIVGDEGDDEGYLVYRNFCSVMRYNPSFKYALAVGLLSDVIAKD